ncbi:MAG: TldD/PmbA family protein [Spirochaetes bacterium]|nr:TldD/PmbA family protein [Spirochaetota bacterium]
MKDKIFQIVKDYSKKGEKVELTYINNLNQSIVAFKGQISSYSESITSGVSSRVLNGKKIGMSFTEKVSEDDIKTCILNSSENSNFVPDDEFNSLYESDEKFETDIHFDYKSKEVDVEKKKEMVMNLEKMCYDLDRRVVNVVQSVLESHESELFICNSFGLSKHEKSSIYYGFVYLIVSDGKDTQVSMYFKGSKSIRNLNLDQIAKNAVEKGIELLGATEIESGKYTTIFSNEVASSLFSVFMPIVYADEIQKGKSKLAGKIGEKIGSDILTIIDDPYKDGLNLANFDLEGVKTEVITIFDKGIFTTPLYNLYTAKKDGQKSNGRAYRYGLSSPITISILNPYIPNGEKDLDKLISSINKGIFVTNIEGLHAGIDKVSGDFSLASKGFLIENGQKTIPLKNFTIAGNFFELIKNIVDKADDRRTDNYVPFSSPALLIEELSISGK